MTLSCQRGREWHLGTLRGSKHPTLLPRTRTSSSLLIKALLGIIQKSPSCLIHDSQSNHLNGTNVFSAGRSRCSGGKQVRGRGWMKQGASQMRWKLGLKKSQVFGDMSAYISPLFFFLTQQSSETFVFKGNKASHNHVTRHPWSVDLPSEATQGRKGFSPGSNKRVINSL